MTWTETSVTGLYIESSNVVETAGNFKEQAGGTPIYGILVAGLTTSPSTIPPWKDARTG